MYDENMQYQTEVDNEVDGLDSHYFVEKELYPALQEIIHAYQNGTDFSMNCDGFNIAIYDKYLGEMIEMSAFDLNDNLNLLRK